MRHLLDSKPKHWWHAHVRHLVIDVLRGGSSVNNAIRVLSKFTGIVDLVLLGNPGPALLPVLAGIPLTRLATRSDFGQLLEEEYMRVNSPAMSSLTHITLLAGGVSHDFDFGAWAGRLGCFPSLTHVALYFPWYSVPTMGQHDFFRKVLAGCAHLRVFIMIYTSGSSGLVGELANCIQQLQYLSDDTRFVLCEKDVDSMTNWVNGAEGGEDYWSRAERFIEQRRSGEIQGSNFVLSSNKQ
ncbi:hypothetical protein FB45DRAFT_889598 [Roridomyces roridus]|uniref:Uncharacterized protein n=1 Tax=Roridomyces roridus TaxID=1738132 RepID=A0AAD7G2T8_9AGAR|nr:hypothetical protein FB45DRAFT_889598 [Roridomyces roridus]